jgi:hypothetical protein
MDYAQCALGRGVSEVEGWQGEGADEGRATGRQGGDARGRGWGTATGGACSDVEALLPVAR